MEKTRLQIEIDKSVIPGLSEKIDRAYSESHRRYHDRNHIEEIWDVFEDHYASRFNADDRKKFFFATIFHDFIYEVGSPDNEILSANAMLEHFGLTSPFTTGFFGEIYYTILGSRNHWDKANDILPLWGQLFLDLDIYHLATPGKYEENGVKLLEEFTSKFTEQQVYEGRVKFLENVLKSPKIYRILTEREEGARQNLQKDIEITEAKLLHR